MRQVLLFFFLFASHFLAAQTMVIKDKISSEPLEVVVVFNPDSNDARLTDENGKVSIEGFEAADSLRVSRLGYDSRTISYELLKSMDFQLYLNPGDFNLSEVVVSATRWQQLRRDIPQKMTSISPEDVAVQNPQTAADLLATSGEVYVQKSQLGGGSPMIRGFATNRVLLAIDGVRMNNAIFRSGNLQNVISVDPLALHDTEVIYGPGSVIYGSDAIGGVMSFYTLRPKILSRGKPLVQGSAMVRTASANFEKTAHGDISIGLKKWGFVSSITFSDFDDLRMGSNGPTEYLQRDVVVSENGEDVQRMSRDPRLQQQTGYQQINLMQKVRWRPNEHWDLNYGAHYSSTSDVPRYDRLIRYRGNQLRSAEWYYGPQEWMMHNLNILHSDSNAIYDKASITFAYQRFGESRHDRDFGSDVMTNRTERVDAFSANFDFEQEFGSRHRTFYGVEAIHNIVGSTGNSENRRTGVSTADATRYPDGATWSSLAAYVTNQFKANEKLTLHTGLRYNVVNLQADFDTSFFALPVAQADITTDALNGALGAAYKPSKSWQINTNLSTGFRAPNVDDVGKVFDSEPGAVILPNPNLSAEYAYNAELGIIKTFGQSLKLDVTVFYTLLNNAMVRRDFQLNGQDSIFYDGELSQVQAIQNAAQATVYGLQAGFELKFLKHFGWSGRFNWQVGEEELDDGSKAPLRHAAPWFGVTHLNYSCDRWQANLYAMFNGGVRASDLPPTEINKDYLYARNNLGEPYAPGWFTLNLKCLFKLTDWVSLSAGIENITDQRYRPYSSGITAPGRNYIGALTVRF